MNKVSNIVASDSGLQMSSQSPPCTDCHGAAPTTAASRTQRSPCGILKGLACTLPHAFEPSAMKPDIKIIQRRSVSTISTRYELSGQKVRNNLDRDACIITQEGHHARRAGTSILHHCFVARSSQSPTLAVAPVHGWHHNMTNTWIEQSVAFTLLRAMICWPLQPRQGGTPRLDDTRPEGQH